MSIQKTQLVVKAQKDKPKNLIDINLAFGEDGGQQILVQFNAHVYSSVSTDIRAKQQQLLSQIQNKQELNDDMLIVFKFQVQSGRERQGIQFIQKGLDQCEENKNISAMQKLFFRPKTTGKIQLKQGKGFIHVIYHFYYQALSDLPEFISNFKECQLDLDFALSAVIKGNSCPSKRTFISIKPDFFKCKLTSQKITMESLTSYFQNQQQVSEQVAQSPIYRLIKNLQIARIDFKFESLRKMSEFYDTIMRDLLGDDIEKQMENKSEEREPPLQNKGIFTKSVSMKVVYSDKIAVEAEMKYKSQEVMLRLVAKTKNIIYDLDH